MTNRKGSVILDERADSFHFSGRYNLTNGSKQTFSQAQISLLHHKKATAVEGTAPRRSKYASKQLLPIKGNNKKENYSPESAETLFFRVNEVLDVYPGTNVIPFTHGVIEPINKHFLVSFAVKVQRVPTLEPTCLAPTMEVTANQVIEIQNNEGHGLGLRLPTGSVQVLHACTLEDNFDVEEVQESLIHTTEETEFITVNLQAERNLKGTRDRTRIQTSSDFHPNGKSKARWILTLMPNATETITYTVQYCWE